MGRNGWEMGGQWDSTTTRSPIPSLTVWSLWIKYSLPILIGHRHPMKRHGLVELVECMQLCTSSLARLVLWNLSIPHTGMDVERSFSTYKLHPSEKQVCHTSEHHVLTE
mmetsp:Transcript_55406/g.98664  ORF Transcript_55406/g.98664 Transcript_55406/m.98664 type:complete len:109 (+) Transcript_55406:3193-3519(+)